MKVSERVYEPEITQELKKRLLDDPHIQDIIIKFKRCELKQRKWDNPEAMPDSFYEEVERLMKWELAHCHPRRDEQIIKFKYFYEHINTNQNPKNINCPAKGTIRQRLEKLVGPIPPYTIFKERK